MPTREVRARARRSSSTASASAEHFDLYDDALFQTEVTELRWDEDADRAGSSAPTAATTFTRAVRRHGQRPAAPAEAARHPRHRDVRGPHLPHQPLGLRLHRRRPDGRAVDRLADKRVGIIGTGATAVQCVPHLGAARRAAVRLPAHAVVGRRARQPPDRPGVVADRSSPAGSSAGWTTSPPSTGGFADEDLVERRLDRHRPAGPRAGSWRCRRDGASRRRGCWRRSRTPTSRRWSRSAPASTRSSRTRRPPRRSSRGTASSASGRASTTSTCRPSTGPNVTLVDTDGKGVERITETRRRRRRHRVRGRLPHLRHRLRGRHRLHAPGRLRADRPRRRDAVREVGRRACARCTACTSTASRTCSSSAAQGANFIANFPHNLNERARHIAYDRRARARQRPPTRSRSPRRPRTRGSSCSRRRRRHACFARRTARPATTTTRASEPGRPTGSCVGYPHGRGRRTSSTSTRGARPATFEGLEFRA